LGDPRSCFLLIFDLKSDQEAFWASISRYFEKVYGNALDAQIGPQIDMDLTCALCL